MRSLFFLILLTICLNLSCSIPPSWNAEAYNTVRFDASFTVEEKEAILEGMGIWERDTGMVIFREDPNGKIFIKKATQSEQDYWEKDKGNSLVGLSDRDDYILYIMINRIKTLPYLKLVAAHEAGHFLGLKHIPQEQTAVMNPTVNRKLLENPYLTRYDLDIFCDHWGCDL